MYKTLYNVISYPLLSHNLLFTFKTVINEDCRLYLLYHHQIIKANFIPFGRNPNEIHVRYLFLVEIRRKESRRTLVPSTFFKYEENNKRHCFTDQIQYTHDARFNAFSIFPIFQHLGGIVARSIIDKSKRRISMNLGQKS